MGYTLGIDLGTTNSAVSIYRKGKPETITIEGQKTFPSVISFRNQDTMMVGHQAKNRLQIDPEHSVSSSKREMGNRSTLYKIYGRDYSPIDVASFVLRRIVMEGTKTLGLGDIKDVVITVPAYFNDSQRADTKEAGKRAGLNVIRLLPEPTAAAIAYGLDKGKDQTIMVYDLGGGTFDITILKVERNNFKVIAVDGDAKLGGDDFDLEIMRYLAGEFKKKTGKDILLDKSKEAALARQIIKEVAENAKIELSARKKTSIEIPTIMGNSFEFELSIDKYNEIIRPYINRTVEKMTQVLKDARMTADDIDRVILVGGSTRNLLVKEVITSFIKDPYTSADVDVVVSHGACIYAASLMTPDKDLAPDIVVKDVTAHSFGIDMRKDRRIVFQPIIHKNTEYPCEFAVGGYANIHQDIVSMNVFRGENPDPGKNAKLGNLTVPITIPGTSVPVPIVACFKLDENGIIHFTAVEFSVIKERDNEVLEFAIGLLENPSYIDLNKLNAFIKAGRVVSMTISIKSDQIQDMGKDTSEDKLEDLIKKDPSIVNQRFEDENGGTIVHMFARAGFTDKVLLCLKYKANINIADYNGLTSLHIAAYMGYMDIVEILLDKGAYVNARDITGYTPLLYALAGEHEDVARSIASRGGSN